MNILTVIGTRPEAIKLAPVVHELERQAHEWGVVVKVCVTGQHREMTDQMLELFEITPDYDLDVMQDDQTPDHVVAAVLTKLGPILRRERPDWVIVQGDTSTVAASSLSAFYNNVRVAHVEAGLRSYDKWQPYPEEINRRIAGVVADLHFAPTEHARQNLLREGISPQSILVTGNPVIDAIQWVASFPPDSDNALLNDNEERLILVTAHR